MKSGLPAEFHSRPCDLTAASRRSCPTCSSYYALGVILFVPPADKTNEEQRCKNGAGAEGGGGVNLFHLKHAERPEAMFPTQQHTAAELQLIN